MNIPSHAAPLDLSAFRNPPARARIAPFWFWNCAMETEMVERQIEQMARAGVGGFFLHPRQGLTLPYLSREWFERVKVAVEAAQKWGMEAWLYDEYPYPSGIAGGILTANHPEFRARLLEQSSLDAAGGETLRHEFPLGRVVSALACPLESGGAVWEQAIDIRAELGVVLTRELFWRWPMPHIPYNEKRFMADEGRLVLGWTPPRESARWRIFVAIETEQRGFKYYDCFVDPLCVGAAEEFIRLTHEGYAETVGEHFGATIPGIFTDEIEPPAWSPEIERALMPRLDMAILAPALRDDAHPRASEVRHAWRECGVRLFHERWEKPIADWCAAHGLIWTAEKPTSRPAQFDAIAQPATDAGHRRCDLPPETLGGGDLRANHRAAIAAAEHNGTSEVRCECFHSLGWGATLQDQKWSIDWLCVQGVNRFTPHAFYATSSGLAKHDAAPSFFGENPYWPHFKLLGDYAGRLGMAMSTGRERARIALLHPTESMWVRSAHSPEVRREYEWLMNQLIAQHHPFHPVDALALTRATPKQGALELGFARYETLLIPPLTAVSSETRAAVQAALRAGMRVLMAAPLGEDAAFAGAKDLLFWPGVERIKNRDDWWAALESGRVLSIEDENGAQIPKVWALWREAGAQQLLFVCNTGESAQIANLEIEAAARGWDRWNLETGERGAIRAKITGSCSRISLELAPFDSVLLVSCQVDSTAIATPKIAATVLDSAGKWDFRLDAPNALRLNRWKIAAQVESAAARVFDDADWPEIEALPLRFLDQVAKKWIEALPGRGESPVWYRRAIECEFVPDDLGLLIENGAILGDWTLYINGEEVPAARFSPASYHGEDKSAARVGEFFSIGNNSIALCVRDAPEMGGLRTPLHLTGSFALGGDANRTLISLPNQADFGDLVGAGLTHFSGTARYWRVVKREQLGQVLAMPPGFGEVAEVSIDGKSLGVRAWSPYEWEMPGDWPETVRLEVALTNTLLPFVEGQWWDGPTHRLRHV